MHYLCTRVSVLNDLLISKLLVVLPIESSHPTDVTDVVGENNNYSTKLMQNDKDIYKQMVYPVIGACQEVHKQMGPFLNEYMYQDALAIELNLLGIQFDKEYQFMAEYKGHTIEHRHFADFRVMNGDTPILVECKAVDNLTDAHRQQLWNYMRLTGINLGLLYNFAPVYAQCEKYCYNPQTFKMVAF